MCAQVCRRLTRYALCDRARRDSQGTRFNSHFQSSSVSGGRPQSAAADFDHTFRGGGGIAGQAKRGRKDKRNDKPYLSGNLSVHPQHAADKSVKEHQPDRQEGHVSRQRSEPEGKRRAEGRYQHRAQCRAFFIRAAHVQRPDADHQANEDVVGELAEQEGDNDGSRRANPGGFQMGEFARMSGPGMKFHGGTELL